MKKLLTACCALLILMTGQAFASDERKSVSININANQDNGIIVSTTVDDDSQTFEFTEQELSDTALIETRLASLDDKTRAAVMRSLTQLAQHSHHVDHGATHKKKIMVVDGDHEVVKKWHSKGENGEENVYAFAFAGDEGDMKIEKHIEIHADHSDELFPVIQHLIKKAKLDAEQVEVLRNLLNEK